MVVAAAVLLTGCARPGDPGAQLSPLVVRSGEATASAVAVTRPPRPGEASCGIGARPRPSANPSESWDVNDARERARRALIAANPPTPLRGAVPPDAIPGAESCIMRLRMDFSLRSAGGSADERGVEDSLRAAGLTAIEVTSGPAFTASTGYACIHGTLPDDFTIGPLAADGSCRP